MQFGSVIRDSRLAIILCPAFIGSLPNFTFWLALLFLPRFDLRYVFLVIDFVISPCQYQRRKNGNLSRLRKRRKYIEDNPSKKQTGVAETYELGSGLLREQSGPGKNVNSVPSLTRIW